MILRQLSRSPRLFQASTATRSGKRKMMTLPKLSVVVPNYNHAQHLPTSLGAILQQSVQPDEIIVLDDASTDNSLEVIQWFARANPHIRLERNDKNHGVVFGMNRGLELAANEYIYFGAADDQLLPGFFEKLLNLLCRFPEAAFCSAVSEWRELATGLIWHMGVGMAEQPSYLSPAQLLELGKQGELRICPAASIFNRASIRAAGGFIPDLKWACDWFAAYVAASRHGICFVPEMLSVYNIRTTSFSVRGTDKEARLRLYHCLLDLLNSPAYSDAALFIRESGAFFSFGAPMLRLIVGDRRYRHFLSSTYLRHSLWYIFRMAVKNITPRFAAKWYFRLAGLRLSPAASQQRG